MDSDLFKKSVKIRDLKYEICEIIVSNLLDKVTWWHFQSTSKEIICPKIFLNYMHGLKSAILAIFQKGLGWPCPVSAALKNAS